MNIGKIFTTKCREFRSLPINFYGLRFLKTTFLQWTHFNKKDHHVQRRGGLADAWSAGLPLTFRQVMTTNPSR